jgi:predicted RNA-binding Zn-ribbon protein involved in translation (DUF1610 family)
MKYYSRDEAYINAECEKCGKILKIKRARCLETGDVYKVEPAAKCFCGNISNIIRRNVPYSDTQNIPKCPTCGSTNIQRISVSNKVGKVALLGILAGGAISKTFKCNKCGYKW